MNIQKFAAIIVAIHTERYRQEDLKASGKFKYTCADSDMPLNQVTSVLGEEFGEVCRAINDGDMTNLKEELIQLAACCVATLERL